MAVGMGGLCMAWAAFCTGTLYRHHEQQGGMQGFKSGSPTGSANPSMTALPMSPPPPAGLPGAGPEAAVASAPTMTSGPTAGADPRQHHLLGGWQSTSGVPGGLVASAEGGG